MIGQESSILKPEMHGQCACLTETYWKGQTPRSLQSGNTNVALFAEASR